MESYATIQYADEYLGGLTGNDAWVAADEQVRQKALLTATVQIDALAACGAGFRGAKAQPEQELEFPRTPDDTVPTAIKRACCHEAAAILDQMSDAAATSRARAIRQGASSVSIGDASESYVKASELRVGVQQYLLSPIAAALVRPYLAVQGVYPIV